MKDLITVALRQQALFIPNAELETNDIHKIKDSFSFVNNIKKLGYTVSENALKALHNTSESYKYVLYQSLCDIKGVNNNWTPLIKGWDVPTGESYFDHLATSIVNYFKWNVGPKLACGHIIPEGTFPLERYNGCPFCGTPFEFEALYLKNQGSTLVVLELWTDKEIEQFLKDILQSKTALDATQRDSTIILLKNYGLPNVQIAMKETAILAIDFLVESNQGEKAQVLFQTPADILRYLWYKHTGFIQMVEPKTILKRTAANNKGRNATATKAVVDNIEKATALKLKFSRTQSKNVALWMNNLHLSVDKICEIMHPKRGIWVRMIRALRFTEYAKMKGFDTLKNILDTFYNEDYDVWQAAVEAGRNQFDVDKVMSLLQERPGMFARSLFANMLWFGADNVIAAFNKVIDKVPARLVFTLNAYATLYFDKNGNRVVKPIGGNSKTIAKNQLLKNYNRADLEKMQEAIEDLCITAMVTRFKNIETTHKTMFIDESLYNIPVSIGDRSDHVQDLPVALMGTRFPVVGDTVRLFMQWGKGLKAQHLDMDLSAYIVKHDGTTAFCSYSALQSIGCTHSGDIRAIPNEIGTAEYINIHVPTLLIEKVAYVVFTCNAYSMGALTPNLVVGWMDSKHPMTISEKLGVAYDPSCVQHQVRITQSLTKGLIFGVLLVDTNEIVWLEMPFAGQLVQGINKIAVETLLKQLSSKLNVGALLALKATAQGLTIINTPTADENYTQEWVKNTAAVTQLLVD